MFYVSNKKELESKKYLIPNEILEDVIHNLEIIESEYPKYKKDFIEKYGPIIVFFDRSERSEFKRKMPVVKHLTTEFEEYILRNEKVKIKKKLYILSDSAILVYERNMKWGNSDV